MKAEILIAATVLGLAQAQQQLEPRAEPLRLTMKQAIELALAPEGNARIQLARELVRQAEARSAQARAALLPNFDSSLVEQSQTRNLAAFGIRIQLPIPGFSFPERVGPFSTMDARVSGSQSIFDFSSIRRFQASRAGIRAAESESDNARDQIAAQVASLYLNALAAQAHVEAAQANVALAQAMEKLAANRKNAGVGTGIEVTRAEVQLANERQRLLVADNGRTQARLQLLRAIGLRLDSGVELAGTLAHERVEPPAPAQALETALKSRADWKAQQRREENARLSYSATKMERLPSLAGFADYGSIGTGLGSALPTRTYGVALRVPLFDGGRRDARRGESASQFRAEQIRTSDLKAQVELEIRLALDNLRSAGDQVEVAEQGLAQAEREVAQAQRRYEAGVANNLEPIDAQARLARARENRIAALLAYNVARISLAQATGTVEQSLP